MNATQRCKNCGGPLGHPVSIALGLDGPCVDKLSNPRTALALADALEAAFREMVNEAGAIGADDYHEAINRAGAALRLAGRLP